MIRPAPAILVLGLGTLVSHGFGLSLIPTMLPRIADDFGTGYGVLGTVTAAGLVAYSVGALAAGRILDRLPSRGLMLGSFAACGVGLLVAGAAESAPALTIATLMLGFTAPVSWAVTLHVAGATVALDKRAFVMAAAASGAALGVLVNGVLIQTSADLHSWRWSFVFAGCVTLLPIVAGSLVFRSPVARPEPALGARSRRRYRAILTTRAGRLVVGAPVLAGAVGFPFTVFLTATALDEMGVSAWSAAALWWIIGVLGTGAGPIAGRYADRASPVAALTGAVIMFAAGLVVLAALWTYPGLVVAALGLPAIYYPIWGLVGAIANRHFEPHVAVRAVTLGLVGAAALGAAANTAAGVWIDATGSFREPVAILAAVMVASSLWHLAIVRAGGLEARPSNAEHAGASTAYDH